MNKSTILSLIVMLLETVSIVLLGVFVFLTFGTALTLPVSVLLVAYILTSAALTVRTLSSGKNKEGA